MRLRTLLSVLLLAFAGSARAADPAMEILATRLAGNFSNEAQAHVDFNYHNVVLHVARLWADRPDGPWLYLEQALADAPGQPYRQQVYQLATGADGTVEVRVYTLPDPVAVTGAWREPLRFATITPSDLHACPGCSLHLKSQPDGSWKGATDGHACASEIHNAAYATSELMVGEHGLVIWDRGFNSADLQVWGPLHTGFDFKRVE
jgi:CpeT protein